MLRDERAVGEQETQVVAAILIELAVQVYGNPSQLTHERTSAGVGQKALNLRSHGHSAAERQSIVSEVLRALDGHESHRTAGSGAAVLQVENAFVERAPREGNAGAADGVRRARSKRGDLIDEAVHPQTGAFVGEHYLDVGTDLAHEETFLQGPSVVADLAGEGATGGRHGDVRRREVGRACFVAFGLGGELAATKVREGDAEAVGPEHLTDTGVAGERFAPISFNVSYIDPERHNPAMNEAALQKVASDSGGAYFRLEEASGLFERLRAVLRVMGAVPLQAQFDAVGAFAAVHREGDALLELLEVRDAVDAQAADADVQAVDGGAIAVTPEPAATESAGGSSALDDAYQRARDLQAAGQLDDAQVRSVLGHEVGHILSDHVLYKTMLQLMVRLSRVAFTNIFSGMAYTAIMAALMEWDRKSELSSDRAGLLCVQNPDAVREALLRSAGGVGEGASIEAFQEQARRYEEDQSSLDSVARALALMNQRHPFPVQRLKELDTWIESGTLFTDWAIRIDRLTAIMLIVVTSVSALVHMYSMGYMAHDENWGEEEHYKARFFAYLSFFTFAMLALGLSAVSILAMELSFVFYNAMLPAVAGPREYGRASGLAWGIGYVGAIFALVLVLMLFVMPEQPALGIGREDAAHIRVTMIFAALWLCLFAAPLFLFVKSPAPVADPAPLGVQLRNSLKTAMAIPGMTRFLLARMLFADGLVTLFAFGGIYAATVFGFSQTKVLVFGIILNITAGIGAGIGGFADDRMGSLRVMRVCLLALAGLGTVAILAPAEPLFWAAGACLGIFIGPLQSSARAWVARKAPPEQRASLFGLMMFSGKATSFVGPLLYGILITATGNDRAGMTVVIALLLAGLLVLPRR